MTKEFCVACNELRVELKEVGLATFLHKYIQNSHVADVVLDYMREQLKGKGEYQVKYYCKHCDKMWEYPESDNHQESSAMTTVCIVCFNPLTKVNITIEESE